MTRRGRWLSALLMAFVVVAAGCGGDDDDDAASDDATTTVAETTTVAPEPAVSGEIVVFAAASLTDVFTELGETFMAENPDATVTFNFAASSELATQIEEGAPADVFASADENNMTKAVEAGAVEGEPVVFVENELQIVVDGRQPGGCDGARRSERGFARRRALRARGSVWELRGAGVRESRTVVRPRRARSRTSAPWWRRSRSGRRTPGSPTRPT